MTREADAAMAAIEKALRKDRFPRLQGLWRRLVSRISPAPESATITTIRQNLAIIATHLLTDHKDVRKALDALDDIAGRFGREAVPYTALLDDDCPITFDGDQLDAAAGYARRGQFADALHHLERALPDGFGDIAERIARHLERTAP